MILGTRGAAKGVGLLRERYSWFRFRQHIVWICTIVRGGGRSFSSPSNSKHMHVVNPRDRSCADMSPTGSRCRVHHALDPGGCGGYPRSVSIVCAALVLGCDRSSPVRPAPSDRGRHRGSFGHSAMGRTWRPASTPASVIALRIGSILFVFEPGPNIRRQTPQWRVRQMRLRCGQRPCIRHNVARALPAQRSPEWFCHVQISLSCGIYVGAARGHCRQSPLLNPDPGDPVPVVHGRRLLGRGVGEWACPVGPVPLQGWAWPGWSWEAGPPWLGRKCCAHCRTSAQVVAGPGVLGHQDMNLGWARGVGHQSSRGRSGGH